MGSHTEQASGDRLNSVKKLIGSRIKFKFKNQNLFKSIPESTILFSKFAIMSNIFFFQERSPIS